jgi:16S rRNA G966 N2-methylase RsmD
VAHPIINGSYQQRYPTVNDNREWALDPFAGIGTVGKAAVKTGRRFVLIEQEPAYVEIIRAEAKSWLGKTASDVFTINCAPIDGSEFLL